MALARIDLKQLTDLSDGIDDEQFCLTAMEVQFCFAAIHFAMQRWAWEYDAAPLTDAQWDTARDFLDDLADKLLEGVTCV